MLLFLACFCVLFFFLSFFVCLFVFVLSYFVCLFVCFVVLFCFVFFVVLFFSWGGGGERTKNKEKNKALGGFYLSLAVSINILNTENRDTSCKGTLF